MRSVFRLLAKVGCGIDDRHAGPGGAAVQVAALPFEIDPAGEPRFLLVTSRKSRRWIIPKGWPIRGLTLAESAAQEAYEEAGVRGAVGAHEVDRLTAVQHWPIIVYPLLVHTSLERWPEAGQRLRRWTTRDEAADAIGATDLGQLILGFRPG